MNVAQREILYFLLQENLEGHTSSMPRFYRPPGGIERTVFRVLKISRALKIGLDRFYRFHQKSIKLIQILIFEI
jgi:hypothetical protein